MALAQIGYLAPRVSGKGRNDHLTRGNLRSDDRRLNAYRSEHGLAERPERRVRRDVAGRRGLTCLRVDVLRAVVFGHGDDPADDATTKRLADGNRDLVVLVVLAAVGVSGSQSATEHV